MKRATLSLRVGIGVLLLTPSLGAQKQTFVPANDVSFTISTDQKSYTAGEQIVVKYRIVNISNGAVYVPQAWEAKCSGRPHVWAWFENSAGQHFIPGYMGSCSPQSDPKSVTERMGKEAVLLKPGDHLDGTLRLDTKLFGGLRPGAYRIEAVLYCWTPEEFTDAERSELARMAAPFLFGEARASTHTRLRS
jgi:hypothetical protein